MPEYPEYQLSGSIAPHIRPDCNPKPDKTRLGLEFRVLNASTKVTPKMEAADD